MQKFGYLSGILFTIVRSLMEISAAVAKSPQLFRQRRDHRKVITVVHPSGRAARFWLNVATLT
jgi:hypothetical protein